MRLCVALKAMYSMRWETPAVALSSTLPLTTIAELAACRLYPLACLAHLLIGAPSIHVKAQSGGRTLTTGTSQPGALVQNPEEDLQQALQSDISLL